MIVLSFKGASYSLAAKPSFLHCSGSKDPVNLNLRSWVQFLIFDKLIKRYNLRNGFK